MATCSGDVQDTQVMGHLPTPVIYVNGVLKINAAVQFNTLVAH